MTLLSVQVEANSCQTIEELLNALNQPWSTIQEYLQQIGKTNRADETWVLYDNPKRKRQWLCPNESPQRTAKPGLHLKMALLYLWWGIHGIVHIEVLKHGETVYADLYCEQLDRLNQSLIEKYPVIINRKGVILKHDNARPHCARKTLKKMNRLGWEVLPNTPYSLDIAPTDFHFFRSMQHFLTNKKFQNLDDMKTAISRYSTEKPIDMVSIRHWKFAH
ncbi:histone-lysine N-methyltransferase SETMAR [Trichonephila clavipes]|nr:histone-lysine N-methyltransferase SETMAR [Trichonephila clavipes]